MGFFQVNIEIYNDEIYSYLSLLLLHSTSFLSLKEKKINLTIFQSMNNFLHF